MDTEDLEKTEKEIDPEMSEQDLEDLEILKNGFVSSASHEMKTPLTTINWYSELLADGDVGELNELQIDYVKQINFASQKMVRIVDSLISASMFENKQITVKKSEVEIIPLLQKVIKDATTKTEAASVSVRIGKAHNYVEKIITDHDLFEQVLYTVIENAIIYSGEKSNIIEIELHRELDAMIIAIRDHGIGIPQIEQSQIFGKFFRASNGVKINKSGVGINLAIAKLIVEVLRGKIFFESKDGIGTTFTIALPITARPKVDADFSDLKLK